MPSQDHLIRLRNKDTKETYLTYKNKKQNPDKLSLMKFSKKLRKKILFTEAKK